MTDLEVENTLREIRERVLADVQRRAPVAVRSAASMPATNGAEAVVANVSPGQAGEALARLDANLATTARTWSRLPPLVSYRRGAVARFEVWLKRLVKRALHWFTWEQVNFNAAVHHALGDARAALGDVLAGLGDARTGLGDARAGIGDVRAELGDVHIALNAQEQALARVREELLGELRALRAQALADRARNADLQAQLVQAESLFADAQARFESEGAQLQQAFAAGLERIAETQGSSAAVLREELETRAAALHAETNARAAELHAELRERVDGLLEEQRVCFKQLSLEAGELAVTHDRARRQLEARLEMLEKK